jgi:hypothetical protein
MLLVVDYIEVVTLYEVIRPNPVSTMQAGMVIIGTMITVVAILIGTSDRNKII